MTRRWTSSSAFLEEIELRLLEREELRKQRARELHAKAKLGALTADEARWFGPLSKIGRID